MRLLAAPPVKIQHPTTSISGVKDTQAWPRPGLTLADAFQASGFELLGTGGLPELYSERAGRRPHHSLRGARVRVGGYLIMALFKSPSKVL